LPRIVGPYAIYGEVGAGGMAVVHFGKRLDRPDPEGPARTGRRVALKCLKPQYAGDEEFRGMFRDEARIASAVVHPNVVRTYGALEHGSEVVLVMDYVPGETLGRLLEHAHVRGEAIPLTIVLGVIAQVLRGLHAAHEARAADGAELHIVHRDMSPANVLVGIDGIVRVLDFGIAQANVRLEATREGRLKGKLAYMAPEQLGAGGHVTRRADVYATSVVLWELLTGKRLFRNDDVTATVADKLFAPIDPPSRHRPGLSSAVDRLVAQGLARDLERRFATAHDMEVAVQRVFPVAAPGQIAEWVLEQARDALTSRARAVLAWERLPLPPDDSPVPLAGERGGAIEAPPAEARKTHAEDRPRVDDEPRRPQTAAARSLRLWHRAAWPVSAIAFLLCVWLNARGGQRWLTELLGRSAPHAATVGREAGDLPHATRAPSK
jgi:serine/threonine-protein kinase